MNAFLPITAFFLLSVALSAAFLCWLPRLTRPDLYFALTVAPSFRDSEEGRTVLRRYRARILIWALGAVVLVIVGGRARSIALMTAGMGVEILGFFSAYLDARRRVRPSAAQPVPVREAPLAPRTVHLAGSWLLQAGPFAILAAAAFYLNAHWSRIPARFPIHWGLDGQPNGWATRSLAGVYGPLAEGALVCALLLFTGYAMLRWSRPIRLGGTLGHAEEHFRRVVVGVLLAAEYLVALVLVWAALLPLAPGPPHVGTAVGLPALFAVAIALILIRQGQGGVRRAAAAAEEQRPVGDRTADWRWKAGMFYVDRDDPALFVEKRFGIGYTLNFGHPVTWVILAAVLLLPIAVGLLAMMANK